MQLNKPSTRQNYLHNFGNTYEETEKTPRGASCEGTTSLNAAGYVDLIPRRLSLVISGRQFAGMNSDVGIATVVCTRTRTHTHTHAGQWQQQLSSTAEHNNDVKCYRCETQPL